MNTFEQKFKKATKGRNDNNFYHFHSINEVYEGSRPGNLLLTKYKQQLSYFLKGIGINDSEKVSENYEGLNYIYNKLADEQSRELLIELMAYRKLGYGKIKLPLCNKDYINGIERIKKLSDCSEMIETHFFNWKLCKYDLTQLGYPIKLFFVPALIQIDFVLKQYEYNSKNITIKAEAGDVVLDAGGCWGDTALYFAHEVGPEGKVFVFEFIPGNLNIMKRNFQLNPELEKRITIVPNPVWKVSGEKMYFQDMGPASSISGKRTEMHNEEATTITIDDLVKLNNIEKLDFIKMDIEGAEIAALKGAMNSIKKFKPKMALCVYHNLTDFFEIPRLIDELELGYRFYLGHYTHTAGETVLYAIPDQR